MEKNSLGNVKNEVKEPEIEENPLEKLAAQSARAIGSVASLVVHSIFFVGIFSLPFFGFSFDRVLLILTTVVSLEAIYLAIFIQMTVNRQAEDIDEVQKDIDDIQEDVEDISEDIEDIQEDVEEIGEDVEGIQKEVEEIGDEVEDISEDIGKEETEEEREKRETDGKLERIEVALQSLVRDIEDLRKER